jgi:hypothetical protein
MKVVSPIVMLLTTMFVLLWELSTEGEQLKIAVAPSTDEGFAQHHQVKLVHSLQKWNGICNETTTMAPTTRTPVSAAPLDNTSSSPQSKGAATSTSKKPAPSFNSSSSESRSTSDSSDAVIATNTGYCDGKDGVLMIQGADGEAAVGTLFFMYVTNHLIYADRNNLVPWVHLNPAFPCYDATVHGNESKSFSMLSGASESRTVGSGNLTCIYSKRKMHYPGPITMHEGSLKPSNFTTEGNGLWESYFLPLSGYPPDDPSCQNKPLIILNQRSVFPGLHICAPWGVRPWSLPRTPEGLRPEAVSGQTNHEWLAPMRKRGAHVVKKYFQPQEWMQTLIEKANPKTACLAIHIRLTDKGHGRKKKPLTLFQSYAEAYSETSGGGSIFVATDDGTILDIIQNNWKISAPSSTAEKSLHYQKNILRSSGESAIFRTYQNETHRTNTEGIVDMYAMSKCEFLVHGFSAMAEAVVYINPALHNRSVNVDVFEEEVISVETFRTMVKAHYYPNPLAL